MNTPYLLVAAFATYIVLTFLSASKKSLPLFFVSLTVIALYIGQAYFLLPKTNSERVTILGEYGYTLFSNDIVLAYLVFLGMIFNAYLLSAKRIFSFPPSVQDKFNFLNFKLLILSVSAILIYVAIVGIDGLLSVRPNMIQGGTFGTTLVLCAALLSLLPILLNKINSITIINIFINFVLLTASGTRIYVIYFLFTLGATLIKANKVKFTTRSIFHACFLAFAVIILGQSIKEYYGGNVIFDDLTLAVEFTLSSFYLAQTEAFASFASVIQFYLDGGEYRFNFGLSVLDGAGLLLPGFLKDFFGDYQLSSSLRFYNYSIIPSAPNDLFQAFFVFGLIFHCAAIFIAAKLYVLAQSACIYNGKSGVDFIFKNYVVSVLCVLFTRGPIDLLIFSILPVYIFVKIFSTIVINLRLNSFNKYSSRRNVLPI